MKRRANAGENGMDGEGEAREDAQYGEERGDGRGLGGTGVKFWVLD